MLRRWARSTEVRRLTIIFTDLKEGNLISIHDTRIYWVAWMCAAILWNKKGFTLNLEWWINSSN